MPEKEKDRLINDLILIGYSRQNATDIFQRYEKLNKIDCLIMRVNKCKEEYNYALSDL